MLRRQSKHLGNNKIGTFLFSPFGSYCPMYLRNCLLLIFTTRTRTFLANELLSFCLFKSVISYNYISNQEVRQLMHNVILRRLHKSFLLWKDGNYYVLRVCIRLVSVIWLKTSIFSAPCYIVIFGLSNILFPSSYKRHDFRKNFYNAKYVFCLKYISF